LPGITSHNELPSDLVMVGYIAGAHGIRGLVRVRPYSAEADALLSVNAWWLEKQDKLVSVEVIEAIPHNEEIVAHLRGIQDRNAAEALRGSVVHISRSRFPELDEDEFYWVDLIGLYVENVRGEPLGIIHDLMDNGAHQILKVMVESQDKTGKQKELLIPFVNQFVIHVDQEQKKVMVDWELDY